MIYYIYLIQLCSVLIEYHSLQRQGYIRLTPHIILDPDPITLDPDTIILDPDPKMLYPDTIKLDPDIIILDPDTLILDPAL